MPALTLAPQISWQGAFTGLGWLTTGLGFAEEDFLGVSGTGLEVFVELEPGVFFVVVLLAQMVKLEPAIPHSQLPLATEPMSQLAPSKTNNPASASSISHQLIENQK